MNRSVLEQRLIQGVKLWNEHTDYNADVLEDMVAVLKPYLEENPYDTEMWMNLALTEYCVPIADYGAVIDSLNWILTYEPNNIKVLLMLTYVQEHECRVSKDVQNRLVSPIPANSEEMAMLLYVQTWYHRDQGDTGIVEKLLKQSIEACPDFVWPHVKLGELYKKIGDLPAATDHLRHSLANVQEVFTYPGFCDLLDSEKFIDELIKGIVITDINYQSIQELYDECLKLRPALRVSI